MWLSVISLQIAIDRRKCPADWMGRNGEWVDRNGEWRETGNCGEKRGVGRNGEQTDRNGCGEKWRIVERNGFAGNGNEEWNGVAEWMGNVMD